jgi:hypothetical protein
MRTVAFAGRDETLYICLHSARCILRAVTRQTCSMIPVKPRVAYSGLKEYPKSVAVTHLRAKENTWLCTRSYQRGIPSNSTAAVQCLTYQHPGNDFTPCI